MQSGNTICSRDNHLTLICDEKNSFHKNLLALVRQWDRHGSIHIVVSPAAEEKAPIAAMHNCALLELVDENGVRWLGAEAVPIIFKNLPFGKLAAALYILPGTMWVTKQLYAMENKIAS